MTTTLHAPDNSTHLDEHALGLCSCASTPLSPAAARRRFLHWSGAALGGGLVAGWAAPVAAGSDHYDGMLVNCIDPRFTSEHFNAMARLNGVERQAMPDNYSHFVIAGGALGTVHPAFKKWHETFWDNLAVSVELHKIQRVVGLTHRDCGAAKIALGDAAVADRASETRSHSEWLRNFSQAVRERHPKLQVITGIIDFDGSIEKTSA